MDVSLGSETAPLVLEHVDVPQAAAATNRNELFGASERLISDCSAADPRCPPQGEKSCWFSVVASDRVPVHITSLEKADSIYEKHGGHVLLGVSCMSPAQCCFRVLVIINACVRAVFRCLSEARSA